MSKLELSWEGRDANDNVAITPVTVYVRAAGAGSLPIAVTAVLRRAGRRPVSVAVDNDDKNRVKVTLDATAGLLPGELVLNASELLGDGVQEPFGSPERVWIISPLGRNLALASWVLSLPLALGVVYVWLELPKFEHAEAWAILASSPFVAYVLQFVGSWRKRLSLFDVRRGGFWFLCCLILVGLAHSGLVCLKNESGKAVELSGPGSYANMSLPAEASVLIPSWDDDRASLAKWLSSKAAKEVCLVFAGHEVDAKEICGYAVERTYTSFGFRTFVARCKRGANLSQAFAEDSRHGCELDKPIIYDGNRVRALCTKGPVENSGSKSYSIYWRSADPISCDQHLQESVTFASSNYFAKIEPSTDMRAEIRMDAGTLLVPKGSLGTGLSIDIHDANGNQPGAHLGTLHCRSDRPVRVRVDAANEADVAHVTWSIGTTSWEWRPARSSRKVIASCAAVAPPQGSAGASERPKYEVQLSSRFYPNDRLTLPVLDTSFDWAVVDEQGRRLGNLTCVSNAAVEVGMAEVKAQGSDTVSLIPCPRPKTENAIRASSSPSVPSSEKPCVEPELEKSADNPYTNRWTRIAPPEANEWAWFCRDVGTAWRDYNLSREGSSALLTYQATGRAAFRVPPKQGRPNCRAPANGELELAGPGWDCKPADEEWKNTTHADYWVNQRGCSRDSLRMCTAPGGQR